MHKKSIHLTLCSPRGFCAGVSRAIAIVEAALAKHGAPVYVRHEIVHNKHVVDRLKSMGAVFVDELTDIRVTDRPVIFSAHGVSKAVVAEAQTRGFETVDATCPLVNKVHHRANTLYAQGHHVVMIGHKGHAEVLGTLGQIPPEAGTLVETLEQAETVALPAGPLALVTQTTLSIDETQGIMDILVRRYPDLKLPKQDDICYATTNRQAAVKAVAKGCDAFIVVGAPNSSNSRQLATVARAEGCPVVHLIQQPAELADLGLPDGHGTVRIGLTAGASAPEELVQGVVAWLKGHADTFTEETVVVAEESMVFKVPQGLA